jgi:predicted nucleotidyltransferase component of viral defense system
MLHTEAVKPATLELLKSLQSRTWLNGFNLAGGTALSLYLGHRTSVDIDLFSNFNFDAAQVIELIHQDYQLQLYHTAQNTIRCNIENVNVDIIAHRYPWLNEPYEIDGIRLVSEPDIVAMKLNAISVSGQRSKDFVDIYFVLETHKYSIADMLKFYQKKYNQQGEMHILKSLVYFDDVDLSDWPVLLRKPHLKWTEIRKKIEKEVFLFMKEYT